MFVNVGLQRKRQELNGHLNLGLQLPQNPLGGVQGNPSALLPASSSRIRGISLNSIRSFMTNKHVQDGDAMKYTI